MNKLTGCALLAFVLALTGTALGQVDDRARELLSGMQPDGAMPEIRTLEQVMTMELVEQGISTTTLSYVDMENERIVNITESMGSEVMMRYDDGVITMVVDGVTMDTPPELAGTFDGLFDDATYTTLLDDPNATASYDGVVSYADVLSGHQVTYTGSVTDLIQGVSGELAPNELRYIFDDDGQLLGTVASGDDVHILSIYISQSAVAGLGLFDAELYEVQGDSATLIGVMRYETVSVNEPFDESIFD